MNIHTLSISLFNYAPVNKTLGVKLEYDVEGKAVCHWSRNPSFDHGDHDTHGGIIAAPPNITEMTVASAAGELVAMATASFAKLGELPAR